MIALKDANGMRRPRPGRIGGYHTAFDSGLQTDAGGLQTCAAQGSARRQRCHARPIKRRNEGCARLLLVIADGGGGVTYSAGRIKYPETLDDTATASS